MDGSSALIRSGPGNCRSVISSSLAFDPARALDGAAQATTAWARPRPGRHPDRNPLGHQQYISSERLGPERPPIIGQLRQRVLLAAIGIAGHEEVTAMGVRLAAEAPARAARPLALRAAPRPASGRPVP